MSISDSIKPEVKISIAPIDSSSTSLFYDHLLRAKDISIKGSAKENQLWTSPVLLVIFAIFVWLKIIYGKKLKQLINVFIGNNTVTQLLREEHALSNRLSIFLSIIFILASALFIFQMNSFYHWHLSTQAGFIFYLKLCIALIIVYTVKIELIKLLGFIFKTEHESSEYVFNIFLFNKISGLFLMPIVICIALVKQINSVYFINLGLLLVSFILIYRSIKGYKIGLRKRKISKFYLFMYLCTLEILPLIVLIKAFISKILILS